MRLADARSIPPSTGKGGGSRSEPGGVTDMANPRARELRKNMTPQEVKLWSQLRLLRQQGFHFRRQVPLEGYVLDFVCYKYRLIIEADGSQHGEMEGLRRDAKRDAIFRANGFHVLRFWNHEIDANLIGVVETIIAQAKEHMREAS
ncbi:MAG: DUF559 domain-containing protein [Methylocystis sp.]|nr:DUF559 domain-containing protein [Methylocystis sp.]